MNILRTVKITTLIYIKAPYKIRLVLTTLQTTQNIINK